MKILILADIHANWPALSVIEETFDACLFVGDLVDYATDPVPCLEWVRANADVAIRGNHDHAVAQRVPARPGGGFRSLTAATRPAQWKNLNSSRLRYLARLPVTQQIRIGDQSFFLVHATPRDPLDEYVANDEEAWASRLESIDADYVCVGHTHIPFHLDLGRTQLINPGSVGQPRDGDPRCSYAVVEDGVVEIRRVPYDIGATIRQMEESGIELSAVEMAENILRSGGTMAESPQMGR